MRLTAIQHHRVDCSLKATYELWTRIDPARSGYLAAAPPASGRSPISPGSAGSKAAGPNFRLVPAGGSRCKAVSRALPLVQALSLYLDRPDVVVTVASRPGTGPGIDIHIGIEEDAAQTEETRAILRAAPKVFRCRMPAPAAPASSSRPAARMASPQPFFPPSRVHGRGYRTGLKAGIRPCRRQAGENGESGRYRLPVDDLLGR